MYAALREWPLDMFIFLVYSFPRPSPHIANLGFAVRFGSMMVPVLVKRLARGREFEEEVGLLRGLGVDTIIAGDVDVEDHLKYMERLAGEVGASLREPLWGMDHEELLYREAEELSFVVIGGRRELLCVNVGPGNVREFASLARGLGVDLLGEYGEYHTQVVEVRRLGASLGARCSRVVAHGDYYMAELEPDGEP